MRGKWTPYWLQILKRVAGAPVKTRHTELSLIISEKQRKIDQKLLSLALQSITAASKTDLSKVSARVKGSVKYPDIWPGEHYKLLAGLVKIMKPKTIVEIGTAGGMSALSMLHSLEKGKLVTFDITPWQQLPFAELRQSDFSDGRLIQCTDDLTKMNVMRKHAKLLRKADLIFIDAAKDGTMEYVLWEGFRKIGLKKGAILVFDDIKEWNMLEFWHSINKSKLDLTSFGHWSGTGFVRW